MTDVKLNIFKYPRLLISVGEQVNFSQFTFSTSGLVQVFAVIFYSKMLLNNKKVNVKEIFRVISLL